MAQLHIVTPTCRPWNLPLLAKHIKEQLSGHQIKWWIIFDRSIFDARVVKDFGDQCRELLADQTVNIHHSNVSKALGGHAHRNHALNQIEESHRKDCNSKDGFIWMLDDDNTVHPNFPALLERKESVLLFHQSFPDGSIRLEAKPENIRPRRCDTAQILFKISALKGIRFNPDKHGYDSDGFFIQQLWNQNPQSRVIVPEPACFYNYLNEGKDQKPANIK